MVGQLMPDQKVHQLIVAEYLRHATRYRRVDMALTHKVDVTFDDFVNKRHSLRLFRSFTKTQDKLRPGDR